nr:RNA-directed DNA polymerase, eukaryota [Tanacetum cinerariifolium]
MEHIELTTINKLWGNSSYDYAFSSSLGNSGGILCVWEPTLFLKENITSSDYFLAVTGTWIPTWDGKCVIMGDFNKVCSKHERYGSVFNVQSVAAFNNFISLASLIDLPLDGYAYTWIEGFDKLVEDTWMHMDITDSNGMILLKKKLQALKIMIRDWTKNAKKCSYNKKSSIQSKLSDIDKIIDQGGSNEVILNDRSILLKELHDIISMELEEMAQKVKVRWLLKVMKILTVVFMVNFEKDFDSIRWDYLDDVLKSFGFGDKWRGWIRGCLKSAKGSVLVNGSPTPEFQFHRGLKQGDPLSPFLFILIMESLHLSFKKVMNAGLFTAIHGKKENLGAHGNITRRSPWLDIVQEINVLRSKEASGDFSVTSVRRLIDDYLLPKGDVQTRWVKVVPIKINVFAWRVRLDKLPTRLNLSLRGVEIPSIMCSLCNSSVESASHLFFYVSCGASYLEESFTMVGS